MHPKRCVRDALALGASDSVVTEQCAVQAVVARSSAHFSLRMDLQLLHGSSASERVRRCHAGDVPLQECYRKRRHAEAEIGTRTSFFKHYDVDGDPIGTN